MLTMRRARVVRRGTRSGSSSNSKGRNNNSTIVSAIIIFSMAFVANLILLSSTIDNNNNSDGGGDEEKTVDDSASIFIPDILTSRYYADPIVAETESSSLMTIRNAKDESLRRKGSNNQETPPKEKKETRHTSQDNFRKDRGGEKETHPSGSSWQSIEIAEETATASKATTSVAAEEHMEPWFQQQSAFSRGQMFSEGGGGGVFVLESLSDYFRDSGLKQSYRERYEMIQLEDELVSMVCHESLLLSKIDASSALASAAPPLNTGSSTRIINDDQAKKNATEKCARSVEITTCLSCLDASWHVAVSEVGYRAGWRNVSTTILYSPPPPRSSYAQHDHPNNKNQPIEQPQTQSQQQQQQQQQLLVYPSATDYHASFRFRSIDIAIPMVASLCHEQEMNSLKVFAKHLAPSVAKHQHNHHQQQQNQHHQQKHQRQRGSFPPVDIRLLITYFPCDDTIITRNISPLLASPRRKVNNNKNQDAVDLNALRTELATLSGLEHASIVFVDATSSSSETKPQFKYNAAVQLLQQQAHHTDNNLFLLVNNVHVSIYPCAIRNSLSFVRPNRSAYVPIPWQEYNPESVQAVQTFFSMMQKGGGGGSTQAQASANVLPTFSPHKGYWNMEGFDIYAMAGSDMKRLLRLSQQHQENSRKGHGNEEEANDASFVMAMMQQENINIVRKKERCLIQKWFNNKYNNYNSQSAFSVARGEECGTFVQIDSLHDAQFSGAFYDCIEGLANREGSELGVYLRGLRGDLPQLISATLKGEETSAAAMTNRDGDKNSPSQLSSSHNPPPQKAETGTTLSTRQQTSTKHHSGSQNNNKTSNNEASVVIAVMTSRKEFNRRVPAILATWANPQNLSPFVQVVFFVGEPSNIKKKNKPEDDNNGKKPQYNSSSSRNNNSGINNVNETTRQFCNATLFNVLNSTTLNSSLTVSPNNRNSVFTTVVSMEGIVDDEYPPVRKHMGLFQHLDLYLNSTYYYSTSKTPVTETTILPWIVIADDDTYINLPRLLRFIQWRNGKAPRGMYGAAGYGRPGLDRQVLEEINMAGRYCMGGTGVILDRQTLHETANIVEYCVRDIDENVNRNHRQALWHSDTMTGLCVVRATGMGCWNDDNDEKAYYGSFMFRNNFKHVQDFVSDEDLAKVITMHPLKDRASMERQHARYMTPHNNKTSAGPATTTATAAALKIIE